MGDSPTQKGGASMTSKIKSVAGHVLATGKATDQEARSLAAYVAGDAAPLRTSHTRDDLARILSKIEGQEGQAERVREIKAQMERM